MKSLPSVLLLISASLLVVVSATSPIVGNAEISQEEHSQWAEFKTKYNKTYSHSAEEFERLNNFVENLRKINDHNSQNLSFELKINKFGDWTNKEYNNYLKNSSNKKFKFFNSGAEMKVDDELENDDSTPNARHVDWREKDAVTPVKDQAQCGSCYAFSATGALEGQYAIKYNTLVSFSEQQIVDCSTDGNLGCDGGLVEYSYDYFKENGVMTEEDYEYTAEQDDCEFDDKYTVTRVSSYVVLPMGNEHTLTKKIAKGGPVAVAIDAGNFSFQFYSSGVYDEKNCGNSPWRLNHAVLAVGYGTTHDEDKDYYIVKNSWGTDWGEDGYIKMSRNEDNQCGIATDAVFPTIV